MCFAATLETPECGDEVSPKPFLLKVEQAQFSQMMVLKFEAIFHELCVALVLPEHELQFPYNPRFDCLLLHMESSTEASRDLRRQIYFGDKV